MDRDGLTVVPETVPVPLHEPAAPTEKPPEGSQTGRMRRRGSFRALHSRPFRLYFAGQVASASGTFLQQTAIGWLVLKLTGSAAELGLVLAVGGVPSLLFGPWGGTVADRVDLRRLLIGTQLASACWRACCGRWPLRRRRAGIVASACGLIGHPRRKYLVFAALAFGICLAATAASPNTTVACVTLLATGAAAFSFVTLASTTLQLHSAPAYRGRIMALWVFVYIGTTPVGSIITGAISSAGGPRAALLTGAGACLVAAALASRVHTPPHPDAA